MKLSSGNTGRAEHDPSTFASAMRRCPCFYGYVVAVFGTMGMVATGPGQTAVIGTTITPVAIDLVLSRTRVSTLYLAATLCSACTLPWMGRLLDRWGPPRMFILAALGLGLTCAEFSAHAQSMITLWISFYFLRLWGQGTMTLVSTNAINLWFEERRGRVMGVASFVNNIFLTGFCSSMVKRSVEAHGWRMTYHGLALLELCIVAPLGFIFLARKPEQYGLRPDGAATPPPKTDMSTVVVGSSDVAPLAREDEEAPLKHGGITNPIPSQTSTANNNKFVPPVVVGRGGADVDGEEEEKNGEKPHSTTSLPSSGGGVVASGDINLDFSLSEALQTRAFWALSAGVFAVAALCTALFFHLDAIFAQDVFKGKLERIYFSSAVAAATATLAVGFILDRVTPQVALAVTLLSLAFAMLLSGSLVHVAEVTPNPWLGELMYVVGLLNGVSMGATGIVNNVAYANWFGRTHNGKIQGVAGSVGVLGSALGPALISLMRDIAGSYSWPLLLVSIWPLGAALGAALAPIPSRRVSNI